MPSSRKNSADLLDRLVELRGLRGPQEGDRKPDSETAGPRSGGVLGRVRNFLSGSPETHEPPDAAQDRAAPLDRESHSPARVGAARHPASPGDSGVAASREEPSPPPWSLEAESLSFRRGFLKILNPGRSPRPVPVEELAVSAGESESVEAAAVVAETRSRPLRARHTIPPLEEPLEPRDGEPEDREAEPSKPEQRADEQRAAKERAAKESTAKESTAKESAESRRERKGTSGFQALARAASGDEAGDERDEDESEEDDTMPSVARDAPGDRADEIAVYGKEEADSGDGPLDEERSENGRARRRRSRRGKRSRQAKDIFREAAEAGRRTASALPRPDVEPAETATAARDLAARAEVPEEVESRPPAPARPFEVGTRLPVSTRPAPVPSRTRAVGRLRARASKLGSVVRRSLEQLLGADLARACRKPLEVSVGTLVVATAVGVVVVALGFLATSREAPAESAVPTGRNMPVSELNLPDIVPAQDLRLREVRNVILRSPDGKVEPQPAANEPADPGEGAWYIQVQAYQDQTRAHFGHFMEYLNKLGYDNIWKFPMGVTSHQGEPFYYLRLGPYPSSEEAKTQCELFKRRAKSNPFGRGVNLQESFPRRLGPQTIQMRSRVRS